MEKINKKELYKINVEEDIRIWGGVTSNVLDLSEIPKSSEAFHKHVDTLHSNGWLPHKVAMAGDAYDYKNRLTPDEKWSHDHILAFLAFLDSLQTNNLPNIAEWITNPHAVYALARQTYDEAIHSKSYGWIFSSIMSKEDAKRIYDLARKLSDTNQTLIERNQFIAGIYQELQDNPCEETFLGAIIGNYMLEGIYFYNGFQFFHNLANRGLMSGEDTQISYIQRDELVHTRIFETIINNFFDENPGTREKYKEKIEQMFEKAVEQEIKFSTEFIGDKILGMSTKSITDYAYNLANRRLQKIGYNKIFPDVKNPYVHLDKQAGVDDETSNRTNNFEETSITYKSPDVLSGWEEL